MFDPFGNNKKERVGRLMATMEARTAFERFAKACPASAYMFAATVLNSMEILDASIPLPGKIDTVSDVLKANRSLVAADAGVSSLAFQFVLAHLGNLVARENEVVSRGTLNYIAESGHCYRELREADELPPEDPCSADALRRVGVATMGEFVRSLWLDEEIRYMSKGEQAAMQSTMMAAVDLRKEAASGDLHDHLQHLRAILARM